MAAIGERVLVTLVFFCIIAAWYSYYRLVPKSVAQAGFNATVATMAQVILYLFEVFVRGYPINQPDVSSLRWFFQKLPVVSVPFFVGLFILQLAILFLRRSLERSKGDE